MAKTLIKLLLNHEKELRKLDFTLYNKETLIYNKLHLLKNDLQNEFKNGISFDYYLKILQPMLNNIIIYDLAFYDTIAINIGERTLSSLYNKIELNKIIDKFYPINLDMIEQKFADIITQYYTIHNVIITLENSDNEGRIIIKENLNNIKFRENIKFIKFPLYNYKILI